MMIKYKVNEVAKDLKVDSKEVIEILSNHVDSPKKTTTALEENELNIVFDTITQKNSVANFNEYFASATKDEVVEEKKVKEEKPKAEKVAKKVKEEKVVETPVEVAKEVVKEEKPAAEEVVEKPVAKKPQEKKKPEVKKEAKKEIPNAKILTPEEIRAAMAASRAAAQKFAAENPSKPANNSQRPANNTQRPANNNYQRPNNNGDRPQGNRNNAPANNFNKPKPTTPGAQQYSNQTGNSGYNRPQSNRTFNTSNNSVPNQNRPQKNKPVVNPPKAPAQQIVRPVMNTVNIANGEIPQATRRVIDTRTSNVNIEKYNEKYDNLAYDKVRNETAASKQKINTKRQQRNKRQGKRETEAERLQRIASERKAKAITITIPDEITVGEFALRLKATSAEVIKKLMMMGTFATINDTIDFDTAELIADEFHAKVEREVVVTIEERIIDDSADDDTNLIERAPVVVVMGHVDHGKTSLLDAIRNADVTAGEAGGITQHIGAYRVNVNDRDITFLDTPGHAAFTTMRARGAQVTDIAVLVVAADDGIMPQTIEAINHAKAAGVSIIVAINKMDKPAANPDQVKQQLTEYELVPEEWGGDVPCIPLSAKTHEGIDDLMEMILLTADVKELKANPDRAAKGTVIEARLDKGRGPIATVLVQNGTLKVGDIIVAGTTVGRVRAMMNDKGDRVTEAGPSVPVEITGLGEVPTGGDIFNSVSDERLARELVEQRILSEKEELFNAQTKVTLDNLFDQMKDGEMKELKVIVKADVQGSVEAVRQSLAKLTNEEVRVNVIHGAVGAVSESDVMLASASNAIIVGFNVRPDPIAEENAKRDGVDMRMYRIIYDCIEEIETAMKGMLAPKFREVMLGKAECREVYKITNVGMVLGSYVTSGKVQRNALTRIVRDGIIVADDKIKSLRRFKDDMKEVAEGYECGITLEKFSDIKQGDILEAYLMEEYRD